MKHYACNVGSHPNLIHNNTVCYPLTCIPVIISEYMFCVLFFFVPPLQGSPMRKNIKNDEKNSPPILKNDTINGQASSAVYWGSTHGSLKGPEPRQAFSFVLLDSLLRFLLRKAETSNPKTLHSKTNPIKPNAAEK